jgi:hypothetical protein
MVKANRLGFAEMIDTHTHNAMTEMIADSHARRIIP